MSENMNDMLSLEELEKVNGGAGGGNGGTPAFKLRQYVYRKGYGDQQFKILRITDNIAKDERDEHIQNFRNNVYEYNISESKEDKVEVKNGVIYQVTTSDNQKNNTYKNISTLDLGDCERELKNIYGIE